MLKRLAFAAIALLFLAGGGLYLFNDFWIHRYDELIARQAAVYRLDPDLVWSIIHEETYFSPWKVGEDGEIGLMQVTPTVGREWAAETGMRELEQQMRGDPGPRCATPAQHPVRMGIWKKSGRTNATRPAPEARVVAGYNAAPDRAQEDAEAPPGRRPTALLRRVFSHVSISPPRAPTSRTSSRATARGK